MTRRDRILTRTHTALALWIAYVTLQTWDAVPLWVSLVGAAAALTPIPVALHRASRLVDHRLAELAARPPADTAEVFTDAEEQLLARLDQELRHTA